MSSSRPEPRFPRPICGKPRSTIPGKLIRIDIDPASLVRPHAAGMPILADAATALAALAAALSERGKRPAQPPRPGPSFATISLASPRARTELRADLRIVLDVIREALPRETVIASDMTQIAYAANEIFPMDLPRRWLHPGGFRHARIRASRRHRRQGRDGPTDPSPCMVGDYGFQYTINELGTAAELKLAAGHPAVEQ